MERRTEVRPGYDCRRECPHGIQGHGIQGDNWWYAVIEGDWAVSISILSSNYPSTVDRATLPETLKEPIPYTICVHQANPEGKPCDWVPGGLCSVVDGSFLGAQEFWEKHGDPSKLEQPETFWKALEQRLLEEMGN